MFEKSGNYEGKYHVLNGVISPIDGVTPDELNIDTMIYRTLLNMDIRLKSLSILLLKSIILQPIQQKC